MPRRKGSDALDYHAAAISRAARKLFENGGTLEDGLNAVVTGAKHEWNVRIVSRQAAVLRVDGVDFEWKADEAD